jgi:hypothetical protein
LRVLLALIQISRISEHSSWLHSIFMT